MIASAARQPAGRPLPDFAAPYAPPDEAIAAQFLSEAPREPFPDGRLFGASAGPTPGVSFEDVLDDGHGSVDGDGEADVLGKRGAY